MNCYQERVGDKETISGAGSYNLFFRLNCPSADDDSFFLKVDDGNFGTYNGLATNGWEWKKISNFMLEEGEHTVTIGYREDGAQLDKMSFSTSLYAPEEMGRNAENCKTTEPEDPTTVGLRDIEIPEGYSLEHNYPNPFDGKIFISFEIPKRVYVSLKVYNLQGVEIKELAGKRFSKGKHSVAFELHNFPKGLYLYKISTKNFTATKRMIVKGE